MADVNANIDINIDTSNALNQLKSLQRQISQFHTSVARSSETAAIGQRSLQRNLINSINSIGAFSAEMRTIKTSAESFTDSLEKNKFSMRKYFTYAAASTKTFGKVFKTEFDTIEKVAEERVKRLQTQYIKMGRDTNGAMKAIAVMPTTLDMDDYGTKVQIAAQKQALFNQLMKQGSTNLLNFGKNTQWAGRQLMVGFTLPLMALGTAATKTFMEMEAQALKFKKVYGDLFTPKEETQLALDNITALGNMFTKYGIAVSSTVGLAAEAAAAGFQGIDLQRQTTEATRLSVLGQIDNQKALETTISLQNAFSMSSDKLAGSIDFLNAVENQTVVSLDDITTAIPKVAPVIQQLGGDVKDLTFFIAAMKEGGINASEGANALKSGLAALINPTGKANEMLAKFGINARSIVENNKGDLKATVIEFAQALNQLDPLNRAQAIEQMFGKFQFARLSTLFANVTKEGNQASRVLELAGTSVEDLAALSEQELGMSAESSMNKFRKSVEDLKAALIPVGEAFLQAITPVIDFVGGILEKFRDLSSGTKKVITLLTVGIGAVGPVLLMTFGLLANGIANIIKLFLTLRGGYQRLTGQSQILGEQTQYMTMEQLDAEAAAHSLNQTHANLTQTFTAETTAINNLISAYASAGAAASKFAMANPAFMVPPKIRKMAEGGIVRGPGTGTSDSIPAMLSNGETVVPAKESKKYRGLLSGIMGNNIPGFAVGRIGVEGQSYNIPTTAGQKALDGVLGKFSKDTEGLRLALETLQSNANELGASFKINAQTLSDFLDGIGVERNNPKGTSATSYKGQKYVAAHAMGNLPDISDPAQLEEIANATSSKTLASRLRGNISSGVPVKQFSNFVHILPEEANKKAPGGNFVMGRDSMADLYSGPQSDRTLAMVYKTIMDRENLAFEDLVNDPALMEGVTGSVRKLGELVSEEIRLLPEQFGEQDFYNAVDSAIKRVDAADTRLTGAIDDMQKTAILAPTGASGKAQERIALGKKDSGARMVLGAPIGAESYKSEGNESLLLMADKIGREKAHAEALAYNAQYDIEVKKSANKNGKTRAMAEGKAYTEELEKTTEDAYVVSRDRKSPHHLAPKDGKDDGTAYNTALEEATGTARRGGKGRGRVQTGVITTGPGTPYNEIASQMNVNKGFISSIKQSSLANKLATAKIGDFSKRATGATFALTSLAGMASMAGGSVGKLGQAVFQVSGALMALSSISSMLKGTKIAAAIASMGLLPIAGVVAGMVALIAVIKLSNAAREKERQAIEGLGNVAVLTKDKLSTLGDFFTVLPQNLPSETGPKTLSLGKTARSRVDSLKADEGFQKNFEKDINALKTANQDQANFVLKSLAIQLSGRGFATDQIQTIVEALQEEAGKTDVLLDVKTIDFSKESIDSIAKSAQDSISKLNKAYGSGITKTDYLNRTNGEIVTVIEMSKELKTELSTTGKAISGIFSGMGGQLKNNTITVEQFKSQFQALSVEITKMPAPTAMLLLDSTLKQMNPDIAKVVGSITNISDKMLALQATTLGVVSAQSLWLTYLKSTDERLVKMGRIKIQELIDESFISSIKRANELTKEFQSTLDGDGKKNPLKERIAAIKQQTEAFKLLRQSNIDAKTATDLSSDSEIAKLIVMNKSKKSIKEVIALVRQYKKAVDDQAKTNYTLGDPVEKRTTDLTGLSQRVALVEKLIDLQNAPQIKKYNDELDRQSDLLQNVDDKIKAITRSQIDPLQNRIDANNYALDLIQEKEDKINEEYAVQAEALNKIKTINQDIAQIQQNRLSLADAITRGDISAAAQLVQESRAQQTTSSLNTIENSLTTSRDARLSALGRNEIEKENKKLQLEIQTIQKTQIVELEKQKTIIEDSIEATRRQLSNLEKSVEQQKNSAIYAGMTKQEIQTQMTLIELGLPLGAAFEDILKNSALNAEQMAKALWDAVEAQRALDAKQQALAANKAQYAKLTPEYDMEAARSAIGLASLKRSSGGMIPKYFASGGLSIGTDTVPAMLTPGEFVMSRYAVKSHGVDTMKAINNGSSVGDSVYNYSVNVNVKSDSNPDEIARSVITQIRQIDSQKIRGNSFR
jgi:TP901 family phage tail tape measure protein